MGTCIIIELVILVCLAWMDKLPHFIANVAAGFIALSFLVILQGDNSLGVNLGVCAMIGFFTSAGASILWHGVRFVCLAIENPRGAIEALDTIAMERAVAKSLAGDDGNPYSYGNRRTAEEVVRVLKERNDGK